MSRRGHGLLTHLSQDIQRDLSHALFHSCHFFANDPLVTSYCPRAHFRPPVVHRSFVILFPTTLQPRPYMRVLAFSSALMLPDLAQLYLLPGTLFCVLCLENIYPSFKKQSRATSLVRSSLISSRLFVTPAPGGPLIHLSYYQYSFPYLPLHQLGSRGQGPSLIHLCNVHSTQISPSTCQALRKS